MKSFKKIFLPLRVKFVILFLALITVPFLISGIITYKKYSADVQLNAEIYAQGMVDQIKINLDRYVKEMERVSVVPLYNAEVLNILKSHNGSYQPDKYLNTDELNKMNLFISSLSFDRSEIESIVFFCTDGALFSNSENSINSNWDQNSEIWMDEVKKEDGGSVILPLHSATYYKGSPRTVISLSRLIREPSTNRPLGIIKIDLLPSGIEKIFSSVSFSKNGKLFITERHGGILYPASGDSVPSPQEKQSAAAVSKGFIGAFTQSDYSGLTVSGQIPVKDLQQDANKLTSFTFIISVISLFFAYILALVSSNALVKPIRHLQSKMKRVQKGSFNERAIKTTNDEIGQLTEVFNTMVEEIERLVKEVYEIKLKEREAEIATLQSQINPHFLYNTLESINMLAVRHNHMDLSEVVSSLGKMLRYTVDRKERPVYLIDEIRFVEAYLSIQAFRLGDRLRTEIYIDPSLHKALVPKLIFQPLVENVIEHGIGDSPVTIIIRTQVNGDDLVLSVSDDGLGIDKRKIEQIEGRLFSEPEETGEKPAFGVRKKGFALRNVHQRIFLLYGKEYGLSIDQNAEKGASIRIRLPFQWEE